MTRGTTSTARTSSRRAGALRLSLGALCALATACPGEGTGRQPGGKELAGELSKLPPGFQLKLPTAPITPRRSSAPAQHPDGSYSVSGLFAQRATLLGKDVAVTGYLVELRVPQSPRPGEKFTPAHLYLADARDGPDARERLLVADFDPEQADDLEVGKRYRVTGTFATSSTSRFTRTDGLLTFKDAAETPAP